MRVAILIILFLHGIIHLIGFAEAFDIYEVRQMTQSISKTMGIMWLITFILCIWAVLLIASKHKYWWLVSILAVAISQMLILFYWKDAKYGTIVNLIILFVSIIGFSSWRYHHQYLKDVKENLLQNHYIDNLDLKETDIKELPEPVKKYIRYTGCIGKPKVNNFKVEFVGKIRKDEQSGWMTFSSEQVNFMKSTTRLFFMNAIMKKLPIAGYHCLKNGIAYMDIRLLSLFRVQYLDGQEMNQAETVTFFNDMCCLAPTTLIDHRIVWEEIDQNSVSAKFSNHGITISVDLFFNEIGELINFKSNDRFNADARKKLPWSTPLKDYQEINGYKLAGSAEAIYTYPDRDLCYGIFYIKSVKYNSID